MQYFSSMSLNDYIQANWMELPKELVDLFEKEWGRFLDQEDELQRWREDYLDLSHEVSRSIRDLSRTIDNFRAGDITPEVLIEILDDEVDHLGSAL